MDTLWAYMQVLWGRLRCVFLRHRWRAWSSRVYLITFCSRCWDATVEPLAVPA